MSAPSDDDRFNELDMVALKADWPEEGLTAGQTGAIVYVHNQGEAFEIEFPLTPRQSKVLTVERDRLLKLRGLWPGSRAG